MKRCKKCNTIVDDQDKFCYVCGEQIPPYTRRRLILIATTLIIFSSIFGILLVKHPDTFSRIRFITATLFIPKRNTLTSVPVSISSNPNDAKVYLDGKYIGNTPLNNYNLSVGVHNIKITKNWYKDYSGKIKVEKSSPQKVMSVRLRQGLIRQELKGKIAFTSNRDMNSKIYVMNADGSNQQRLTHGSSKDFSPCFSPDGTKIAFVSWRNGWDEIYVMNADGSNQQRLTKGPYNGEPCFSPDGTKIAFVSDRDGDPEIYVMNADGSNQQRLTHSSSKDFSPCFSPDGTKIAFQSREEYYPNPDIYVMNADGSNRTRLTNNPAEDGEPTWGP